MEITDLKSAAMLLTRYYTIQNLRGTSNDILCIQVAQGAAKNCKRSNLKLRKNVFHVPGKTNWVQSVSAAIFSNV